MNLKFALSLSCSLSLSFPSGNSLYWINVTCYNSCLFGMKFISCLFYLKKELWYLVDRPLLTASEFLFWILIVYSITVRLSRFHVIFFSDQRHQILPEAHALCCVPISRHSLTELTFTIFLSPWSLVVKATKIFFLFQYNFQFWQKKSE